MDRCPYSFTAQCYNPRKDELLRALLVFSSNFVVCWTQDPGIQLAFCPRSLFSESPRPQARLCFSQSERLRLGNSSNVVLVG